MGTVTPRSSSVRGASVTARASTRCVSSTGAAGECISTVSSEPPEVPGVSVGADAASTEASDPPLAPVAPSLRRSAEVSGTLTTACLTTLWPRSIDWATNAVPVVAAAEPMATPMMVPFTPKADAHHRSQHGARGGCKDLA